MEEKRSRFQSLFPYLSAGYFVVLTIYMTWPLVTRMDHQMIGQVGDNIYFVWMIGWFKKAVFDLHVNPFNVWFLNYPEGWNLAYTEITPAQLLLALPFSLVTSPTFAYNAAHLLSFILSGLILSLWVRRLTGSMSAALLAGTAYAFLPFHFAHFLIGHLNLSGLQWFPLFFWGFFDLLLIGHTSVGRITDKGHAERSEASRQEGKESLDGEVSSVTVRDPSLPLTSSRRPSGRMTNKSHAERSEASRQESKKSQDGEVSSVTVRDPSLSLRMTADSHAERSEASRTMDERIESGNVSPMTGRDPSLSLRMTVGEMTVGEMTVGEMTVGEMTVGGMTNVEMTDARMTEGSYVSPKLPWNAILKIGIGLGLIALTSQYYLYMTILIAAFIWLMYVFLINRNVRRQKSFWTGWLVAGLIALPLIAIAVAPYVSLAGQGGLPDRELGIVRPYSAGLTDFLLPSTDHFLWGSWVGSHFNRDMWVEGTLYVGLISTALAVLAWFKRRETGWKNLLVLMLAGGALALLLAMGTDLHWNGAPVEITTPGFLQGLYAKPTIPIPLPGLFLFKYFPFYAKLRALMRFGIFVLLFICAAAGLGTAEVLKRISPRWKFAAAAGLILLVLFDFYPGAYTQFTNVQPRAVDLWLASQPGEGAVAQLPFTIAEDQEHTYFTLVHGKPYIGGFFNAFPPVQYKRIKPVLMNFPDEASIQLLRELKVRWVLVDPVYYSDWNTTRTLIESFGLALEAQPGGMAVFTLQVDK